MTEEDLVAAGYKKYTGMAAQLKHADCYYAKMLTDEIGKKYQIVIYVYDYANHPHFEHFLYKISFMPDVQFRNNDTDLTADIVLHNRPEYDIQFIEAYYEKLWIHHGSSYCEKWEDS